MRSAPGSSTVTAQAYTSPFFLAAVAWTIHREDADRIRRSLKKELERRATSDDVTGVSNRAYISLLAQNEFARARSTENRFPASPSRLTPTDGDSPSRRKAALMRVNTIIQVLSGYCVVVMRHCDSFGRLGPFPFSRAVAGNRG